MQTISFMVIVGATKNEQEISIGEKYQAYAGKYAIREISAKDGIDAIDRLIRDNPELQENPDQIKPEDLRKSQIEFATTLDGEPLILKDLANFPNKLWQILVAANQILNSVSLEEARFLLQPSSSNKKPSIQQ